MSLAQQAKALAQSGAKLRRETFGLNANAEKQMARMDEAGTESALFECYFSAVTASEQMTEALFKDLHQTVLRVDKTEPNFKPIIGKKVRLIAAQPDGTDMILKLNERANSPGLNPEHIFGCENLF